LVPCDLIVFYSDILRAANVTVDFEDIKKDLKDLFSKKPLNGNTM
jgi:hypothetical protein